MMGAMLGKVKIHLMEAHLKVNDGNFANRMSPFVIFRING